MTPDNVLLWTSLNAVCAAALAILGMVLFWRGTRRPPGNWYLPMGMLCVLLMVAPLMTTLFMGKSYPGDGIIDRLTYSAVERNDMRTEGALVRRLRPSMRLHSVVCPDPTIFAPDHAKLLEEWNNYYSSFLEAAPLGRDCYYYNRPFNSGIERPIGRLI